MALKRHTAPLMILALLTMVSCGGERNDQATPKPDSTSVSDYQSGQPPAPESWPANGRDMGQTRFSPLEDINGQTINRLGLAWEFKNFIVRGRTHHGMESNPVLFDGMLYVTGPWGTAYALDARTGELKWEFEPALEHIDGRSACCDAVNRGLAIADGKIFVGAFDGILYALDAKTGAIVWQADTFVNRHWNYSITSAPFLAGDKVMIGNAGGDMGVRGYVSAYNIDTGELAWRFWAVPGDPAAGPDETPEVTMARATWPKDTRWELGLGGNAWDNLGYDPETNTAFLALGNGGPHPAWLRSKSGKVTDQLFLSSIVAVDANTGRMKWHYQTTPGDSWDFAATSHMILADIQIDGATRRVIMQAPKNGIFYVLDRDTGELLRADPITTVNWTTGVDLKTGRPAISPYVDYSKGPVVVFPSAAGGHAWQPMSFSPRTGLVYLHVYNTGMRLQDVRPAKFLPGTSNQASAGAFPPFKDPAILELVAKQHIDVKFEARLKAWNPVTGKAAWESDPLPFVSGGTLVAGDLVFQGTTGGYFNAYDATSGKRLLNLFIGTNIMAAPVTYKLDGIQYIAITAGAGGPQGAAFAPDTAAYGYENYERLLVLKLDGGDVPLPPKRMPEPQAPTPQTIQASAGTIEHGKASFEAYCSRCHAVGGATGIFPNLWNMPSNVIESFQAIVGDGAYRAAGMSGFSDILSNDDIAAIKAFIVNDIVAVRTTGKGATSEGAEVVH
jgi:quinohemoprotein ethanol dehydrogenase